MTATNTYLSECERERAVAHQQTLEQIGMYLTRLLRVFGVIDDGATEAIGFPMVADEDSGDVETKMAQFGQVWHAAPGRQGVRQGGREGAARRRNNGPIPLRSTASSSRAFVLRLPPCPRAVTSARNMRRCSPRPAKQSSPRRRQKRRGAANVDGAQCPQYMRRRPFPWLRQGASPFF